MSDVYDADRLAELASNIDRWLHELREEWEHITSVESMTDTSPDGGIRWFVRMSGEEKDVSTVWFVLGQRSLRFENYVLPSPEENVAAVYENVLRRNNRLAGLRFSIGDEDAIFLRGELANDTVTAEALDRVLGSVYATVELCFRPLIRMAFESKFGSLAD